MTPTLILAIAATAVGAAGAWTVQSLRYDAKIAGINLIHARAHADQIATSARDYRRWAEHQSQSEKTHIEFVEVERVKYQTIIKTVEKLVDRPVYRNVCIDDDGMRVITDAIATTSGDAANPARTGTAVPDSATAD